MVNPKNIMRGDIIWLDINKAKVHLGKNIQNLDRPFAVISNKKNNYYGPTVNIVCLTKKTHKSNYPMHVLINKEKYNLKDDSVILTEQILTVNKNFIKDKVGRLDKEDRERLNKALAIQILEKD